MEKITLGGRDFELTLLSIDALAVLSDAIDALSNTQGSGRASVEAGRDVILAALADDYPEFTVERLGKLRSTIPELNAAVSVVLRVSGLSRQDPGEAAPAAIGLSQNGLEISESELLPARAGIIERSAA